MHSSCSGDPGFESQQDLNVKKNLWKFWEFRDALDGLWCSQSTWDAHQVIADAVVVQVMCTRLRNPETRNKDDDPETRTRNQVLGSKFLLLGKDFNQCALEDSLDMVITDHVRAEWTRGPYYRMLVCAESCELMSLVFDANMMSRRLRMWNIQRPTGCSACRVFTRMQLDSHIGKHEKPITSRKSKKIIKCIKNPKKRN